MNIILAYKLFSRKKNLRDKINKEKYTPFT